jgi:hypothetical protein
MINLNNIRYGDYEISKFQVLRRQQRRVKLKNVQDEEVISTTTAMSRGH